MADQQTSEKEVKSPQPDDAGGESKSELEELKQEMKDLKAENKRIRKEELDQRTDPNYIKRVQDDRRKKRESQILNQRLPIGKQLTREQMQDMTNEDMINYVNSSLSQMSQSIQRDKINPMMEQQAEDNVTSGLRDLEEVDNNWFDMQDVMLPIARANPDFSPIEVFTMALTKEKRWDRLDTVRAKLNPKKAKQEDTTMPKEKEDNKDTTPSKPRVAGGERPSSGVTSIKTPSKPMTAKEAATKAYEDATNSQL